MNYISKKNYLLNATYYKILMNVFFIFTFCVSHITFFSFNKTDKDRLLKLRYLSLGFNPCLLPPKTIWDQFWKQQLEFEPDENSFSQLGIQPQHNNRLACYVENSSPIVRS